MSLYLPTFIRSVRESLGISQKDLAFKLGVTPSAITQYEKSLASLSKEKIMAAASVLNLNRDFIATGTGNPFILFNHNDVIHMFASTMPDGSLITEGVLKGIVEHNKNAAFIFLKPAELPKTNPIQARRWQKKGLTTYAFIILDSDQNFFLFRKKDNAYFNEEPLKRLLREMTSAQGKQFLIKEELISNDLYLHIQNWDVARDKLTPFLKSAQSLDNLKFLSDLLNRSAGSVQPADKEDLLQLQKTIEHDIEEGKGESIVNAILPEIYRMLKNRLLLNKSSLD